MGFLDRLLSRPRPDERDPSPAGPERAAPTSPRTVVAAVVLRGRHTLEVVGESKYQDHLWKLAGGYCQDRIRCPTQAVLDPEPTNPHDKNAIRVLIEGGVVGYLSREDAIAYLPGLGALMERCDSAIALEGHIVGGGPRGDRIGMLGVFLDHDPADFGVRQRDVMRIGELRTGLTEAIATDLANDSYDLSWLNQLSGARGLQDIAVLRTLLLDENDPIDRHFMLSELGKCLYKNRDAFDSALVEFDAVCQDHHAEMDVISAALVEKFACVPVIDLYRQAAIRCQKTRDWAGERDWAARGLSVYGSNPARPEAVADLEKRLAHAEAKLAAPTPSRRSHPAPSPSTNAMLIETLTCSQCGTRFQRERTRGRKPHRCPTCRGA